MDFYQPPYNMNKTHWNSIILEGTVPDKDIRRMIGESYDLTKGKERVKKAGKNNGKQ